MFFLLGENCSDYYYTTNHGFIWPQIYLGQNPLF